MSVSDNGGMMLMTIATTTTTESRRSTSPLTPSPSREMRGIRLFRAISRKLARRSQEDLNFEEDDSRSSSTDSSGSGRCSRSRKECRRSVSPQHISSSSSDAGSDGQYRPRHALSTSAESIRRVFQNLTVGSRSKSCNNSKDSKRKGSGSKKTQQQPQQKKILRSPVAYTYVKGLSGLPTRRVPKPRVYLGASCANGCSVQYMAALNR